MSAQVAATVIGRPRIEPELSSSSVTTVSRKFGVLLALERERMQRIDDHARQPRRIEHALFEIELPGAVLLRQQPPLQPVGEPSDHALQVRELLVEIAAQPVELLGLAEILRADDLVELGREGLVVGTARLVGDCARGRHGSAAVSESPISASSAMSAAGASIASAALSGMSSAEASASSRLMRSLSADSDASPSSPDSSLRLSSLALVAFLLVGVAAAILAHVEGIEQIVHDVAEAALILDHAFEPVEIAAGALLDQRAPQIDELARGRRRLLAGQPLAHDHGDARPRSARRRGR